MLYIEILGLVEPCSKPTSATGFNRAFHSIHYLQRKENMDTFKAFFMYPFVASATARM